MSAVEDATASSIPLALFPGSKPATDSSITRLVPRVSAAVTTRLDWERRYRRRMRFSDATVVLASTGIAAWVQIATIAQVDLTDAPWQYGRVFLLTAAIWLFMLAAFQTRDVRTAGHGTTEYRRVAHATGLAFGVVAIAFVLLQSQGIRTQLLIALPVGMAGIVLGRWGCRQWLIRQRARGGFVSRAIVVGRRHDVEYVVRSVDNDPLLGYRVVGVSLEDGDQTPLEVAEKRIPAMGTMSSVGSTAALLAADAVIVASTPDRNSDYLKRLSWQLEGTAAELVISSPLADVVGPRMALKPVEGLPLIQVQIPTFDGPRYAIKRVMDVVLSTLALVVIGLAAPFVALAIKLDSRGPVFFRQERVGRDGQTFRMLKFRSMRTDAEAARAALLDENQAEGPLFKMRDDPRVTRVGVVLRRFSIDELPQFWNVLIGDMSLVGPRPPLPSEVTTYDGIVYRRLYIKPGITGLWQVSGRSDLAWEDAIRLDLRYVENWSVIGDLTLLWRTVGSVLAARGAY